MFIGEYQYALDSKNRIIILAKLRESLGNKFVVRFFFSGACKIELDKQSRGLIPQNLKEYAEIQKEIVSIRVLSKVEIWSKENCTKYNESDIDFDYIAEKMNDLGI